MRALVTGGSGFVGRHLIRRLLEDNWEVVCVDNIVAMTGGIDLDDGWPLFDPRSFDNFTNIKEDCRTYFVKNMHEQFDVVFHLAAIVGGRLVIEHNPLAVADDLAIDAAMWQWAKESAPGKVVCFSSSAAYPITLQRPNTYRLLFEEDIEFEGVLGQPDMSYGWSKLTHEYLAKLAFENHGIKSVVYRPFSGYGEDQDASYPFPSICKRIIDNVGADTISVWGSGRQMRDFIHISDCVTGILQTMDQIDNASALNLSTGIYTSFSDFAFLAAEQYGYSPTVTGTSDKPEGVFARGGDISKQKALGFEPKISFAEGVARGLAYFDGKQN